MKNNSVNAQQMIRRYNQEVHPGISLGDSYTLDESEIDDFRKWEKHNAEFICKAVNNFDSLVAALKVASQIIHVVTSTERAKELFSVSMMEAKLIEIDSLLQNNSLTKS